MIFLNKTKKNNYNKYWSLLNKYNASFTEY